MFLPRMKPFLLAFVVFTVAGTVTGNPADELPKSAAHYFRTEGFHQPTLSPDGNHLFNRFTKPNDHDALAFMDLQTGQIRPVGVLETENFGDVHWLDSDNLIAHFEDSEGIDSYAMFNLNRETLKFTTLTNYRTRILGIPVANPTNAWVYNPYWLQFTHLLEIDGLGKTNTSGVWGERNLVRRFRTPRDVKIFLPQANGEVRFVFTQKNERDKFVLHWRSDPGADEWQPVPVAWEKPDTFGVDASATGVFVARYEGQATRGLYRLDAATGTLGDCLYRDDTYSLDDAVILYARRANNIKGLRYMKDRSFTVWFDRKFQGLQNYLDEKLPDARNEIFDWSVDETVFLLRSRRKGEAERLLMMDLRRKKLSDLTGQAPWIPRPSYADTETVAFTSRDGHALRAFLTKPRGATAAHRAPLVVLFHEEAGHQSHRGYNAYAQWLAANGYATIQVNPRHAKGQIKALSEDLKYDRLGGALDYVDAVRTVVADPSLDPARVGALAFGPGGQLALHALVDGGSLFRGAVIRNGMFRMDRYLDLLKKNDPHEHASIKKDLGSSTEMSARYHAFPDGGSFSKIKARVILSIDRALPPGTQPDFRPGAEGRFEDDALFLQRALNRAGIDAQVTRTPPVRIEVDKLPLTVTELGKALKEVL